MKRILIFAALAVVSVLAAALVATAWLARPFGGSELRSQARPASDYSDAAARIDEVLTRDKQLDLSRSGGSIALLHGSQTETSVVIFHGYTDVPEQFALVAQGYFDAGANVYIPRAPYHGYSDLMTSDPSKLTAEELRRFTDESIDIGRGLGDNVVVAGMSGGGALATWAAAERPDVSETIVISPLILPPGYQPWMVRPLARAIMLLPDSYTWWTEREAAEPGPEYPRYSLHGIASYLLLAERAKADASSNSASDVVLVANLGDPRLDMAYPEEVLASIAPGRLRVVRIPAADGLAHDIVGYWGDNRPKLREAYRWLESATGVDLPDPLSVDPPVQ